VDLIRRIVAAKTVWKGVSLTNSLFFKINILQWNPMHYSASDIRH